MNTVNVHNIVKRYEHNIAVDDVSFQVQEGEIFGLIGPDGAGKTSLFRVLTTLLLPDGGNATVLGYDVVKDYRQIRNRVGYMPGKFSLYQDLSVIENLTFFATLFKTSMEENLDLINDIYVQIEPFKDRRAGKLSGGMKQKLALCCALIHKPEVLFLDEPTTGVDVVSRKEFWEMLGKLRLQGITIMVSTPYMDEANQCDRIALMQKGKIMSIDTPARIIRQFPKAIFAVKVEHIYRLSKCLENDPEIESCFIFGEYLHVTLNSNTEDVSTMKNIVSKYYFEVLELNLIMPSIEDTFIRLMQTP